MGQQPPKRQPQAQQQQQNGQRSMGVGQGAQPGTSQDITAVLSPEPEPQVVQPDPLQGFGAPCSVCCARMNRLNRDGLSLSQQDAVVLAVLMRKTMARQLIQRNEARQLKKTLIPVPGILREELIQLVGYLSPGAMAGGAALGVPTSTSCVSDVIKFLESKGITPDIFEDPFMKFDEEPKQQDKKADTEDSKLVSILGDLKNMTKGNTEEPQELKAKKENRAGSPGTPTSLAGLAGGGSGSGSARRLALPRSGSLCPRRLGGSGGDSGTEWSEDDAAVMPGPLGEGAAVSARTKGATYRKALEQKGDSHRGRPTR